MKKLNPKIAVLGACLLMLGGLVGSAKAQALKGLRFEGTLTEVPGCLTGAFLVGDPFTVEYFFDPAFVDTDPNPRKGEYFGAIKCFVVTVGSYQATSSSGRIEVRDDFENAAGFTFDRYFGAATGVDGFSGPPILPDGTEGISCEVLFLDSTLAAFFNDSMPLDIVCAAFLDPDRRFTLLTNGPAGVLGVTGRIDFCTSLGWGVLTPPGVPVDVQLVDCLTGVSLGVELQGLEVAAGPGCDTACPITCAVETFPILQPPRELIQAVEICTPPIVEAEFVVFEFHEELDGIFGQERIRVGFMLQTVAGGRTVFEPLPTRAFVDPDGGGSVIGKLPLGLFRGGGSDAQPDKIDEMIIVQVVKP